MTNVTVEDRARRVIDRRIYPCARVQTWGDEAREAFVGRDGLPPRVRLIENGQLVSRISGALPHPANAIADDGVVEKRVKRVIGIHLERKLPCLPQNNAYRRFRPAESLMADPVLVTAVA